MIQNNELCSLECHDEQKIKYICVHPKCQTQQKIGCADCFLDNHSTVMHSRIGIQKFEQEFKQKVDVLNNIEITKVSRDSEQFNQEFNYCLQSITQKFNQLKEDLQKEVDNEVSKYENSVIGFNQQVDEIVQPIQQMTNNQLLKMNQDDLHKTIKFHQNYGSIKEGFRRQIDQIEVQRNKVNQKKAKAISKLYNVADVVLREIEEFQNRRITFSEETPEKMTNDLNGLQYSGSSQDTIKPTNFFEEARQKKYPKSIIKQKQ